MKVFIPLLMVITLVLPAAILAADPLDGWQLVQLAAMDRAAVVRSPAGELKLVHAGDRLGGQLTIAGFDGGRLVLERPGEWGRQTLFVTVDGGRQRVAWKERQPLHKADVYGDPTAIVSLPAPATGNK